MRFNCEKLKALSLSKVNHLILLAYAILSILFTYPVTFSRIKCLVGGSFLISDDLESKPNDIVEVPAVKLDDEMDRLGIQKVDFIKRDIEGIEIEAIKGCKWLLKSNRVNLAIASFHILDGLPTCKRLEGLLLDMGYNFETTNPQQLTTYGWKHKIDRFLQ